MKSFIKAAAALVPLMAMAEGKNIKGTNPDEINSGDLTRPAKHPGMQKFSFGSTEVWAINEKNALRKIRKMKQNDNNK